MVVVEQHLRGELFLDPHGLVVDATRIWLGLRGAGSLRGAAREWVLPVADKGIPWLWHCGDSWPASRLRWWECCRR